MVGKEGIDIGNSEMQILRWGIPGWIAVLTYIILSFSINNYDAGALKEKTNIDASLLAGTAILTVIGIPLGYVVYQIYFCVKWKFFNMNKKIDSMFSDIVIYNELSSGDSKRNMNSMDSWKKAERTFNIFLSEFINKGTISYKDIMRQYKSFQSRTNRVHGLGASFTGIVLSIFTFIVFQFSSNGADVFRNCSFILTLIIVVIISFVFFSNYKQADEDSFKQMRGMIVDIGISRIVKESTSAEEVFRDK